MDKKIETCTFLSNFWVNGSPCEKYNPDCPKGLNFYNVTDSFTIYKYRWGISFLFNQNHSLEPGLQKNINDYYLLTYLYVNKHWDVDKQRHSSHRGDVHEQVLPPLRGSYMNSVGMRRTDCIVALQGQCNHHKNRGTHRPLANSV